MKNHHPKPPGKTKTALRRGNFTPRHAAVTDESAARFHLPTTYAEQALLFAEAASEEPVPSDRPVD